MSTEDEILNLLKSYLDDIGEDPSKALPEARLEDIGVDSLLAVDLVFRLEEHFKIDLQPQAFRGATVQQAVALVLNKVRAMHKAVA